MASSYEPKAGQQGLFYYYYTMAKTLRIYGEPIIVDKRGVKHDWARELSQHLLSLQHEDGYWLNTSGRWWENIKALDTSYVMVALSICREELARQAQQEK